MFTKLKLIPVLIYQLCILNPVKGSYLSEVNILLMASCSFMEVLTKGKKHEGRLLVCSVLRF